MNDERPKASGQLLFADSLYDLTVAQSKWSQETFGTDDERGPLGALKHLEREAVEAQEAVNSSGLLVELADCLLLLIDASRRAGFSIYRVVDAAIEKQAVNEQRAWPKPTDDSTPVEHIKQGA